MKANITLLKHYTEKNQVSSLRLHIFIANRFNNHLHRRNFAIIRKELGISNSVIYKSLKQIAAGGLCIKKGDHYWRFYSWRKLNPDAQRSKNIYLDLKTLRCLKKLRTLYYTIFINQACNLSKRNAQKKSNTCFRLKSGGYPVSASFVTALQPMVTIPCISKHIRRAESFGFIKVKKQMEFIARGSYKEMKSASTHIENSLIKFFKGQYSLFKYAPNLISMS